MFQHIRPLWSIVSTALSQSQQLLQRSSLQLLRPCKQLLSTHSTVFPYQQCSVSSSGLIPSTKPTLAPPSPVTFQSVRTKVRVYYKGSAWKRYNKHNIEKRLMTHSGLQVLWRRVLKGRHQLAVYERILPNTVEGKILPKSHFKYKAQPHTKYRLPKPGLF